MIEIIFFPAYGDEKERQTVKRRKYSVIPGYTHVDKNAEDGKTRQCMLDGQFVHHPEMYKVTTIMRAKNFSWKWASPGNGIFGELAFRELAFGEPTFEEKKHNTSK